MRHRSRHTYCSISLAWYRRPYIPMTILMDTTDSCACVRVIRIQRSDWIIVRPEQLFFHFFNSSDRIGGNRLLIRRLIIMYNLRLYFFWLLLLILLRLLFDRLYRLLGKSGFRYLWTNILLLFFMLGGIFFRLSLGAWIGMDRRF